MRSVWLAVVLAAAACNSVEPPLPTRTDVTYLSPAEHLARASLALRGIRPSIADLVEVTDHPDWLPGIIDGYLDSSEFGTTVRELHDELLRLHPQQTALTPAALPPLEDMSFSEMNRSIYDEPLRLIEDVVMTDQPYTRIVTADYTLADRIVATVWGLAYSGDGWQRTAWNDDRGAAGILASPAMYIRYRSTKFSYNRARANAFSRSLLCHDFSDSDIHIDTSVDLSNPDIIADAVVHNPSCAGCHQAMDPLASYFFGFHQGILGGWTPSYPGDYWQSSDTENWRNTNHRPPGYFGQSPEGLAGLGQAIADDPRFARCAVVHFASYLTEASPRDLAPAWVAQLQSAFVEANYSVKQLARRIVLSEPFRTASVPDPVAAEAVIGYQKVRPQQLQHLIYDLTGFLWQDERADKFNGWRFGHVEYLVDDFFGFRVLAGGTDSWFVTEPTHTMNSTASLVAQYVARRAAAFVVEHDALAAPSDRRLFTRAPVDATDRDSVRAELAELHARIFSELVAPDDPALDDSEALFVDALAASGDPRRAWTVTLTGMMSDLRALYY